MYLRWYFWYNISQEVGAVKSKVGHWSVTVIITSVEVTIVCVPLFYSLIVPVAEN